MTKVAWACVILVLLVSLAHVVEGDYSQPRLHLMHPNIKDVDIATLMLYRTIATGSSTAKIAQKRAEGSGEWVDSCLFADHFGPFRANEHWPSPKESWWVANAPNNPTAALDLQVWRADSATGGVGWWLRDKNGDKCPAYVGLDVMVLDLGPDCTTYQGKTAAEWLGSDFLDSFSATWKSTWGNAVVPGAWQIDDSYCVLPGTAGAATEDSVVSGGVTYYVDDFRDYAWTHFRDNCVAMFRSLHDDGVLLRINHHYNETECTAWASGTRGMYADSMKILCEASNMEGCPQGPGPCPIYDNEAWTRIFKWAPTEYEMGLSAVQTKIMDGISADSIEARQKFGLAMALMDDTYWGCTRLLAWNDLVDLIDEAYDSMGVAVGPAVWDGHEGTRKFCCDEYADTTIVYVNGTTRIGTFTKSGEGPAPPPEMPRWQGGITAE